MKRRIKKILGYFPPVFLDYFELIFSGAAENHIRITKSNKKKFRSYTQLKKQQKKVRTSLGITLLILLSIFLGIILGPLFFPQPIESQIYIPNGKADILLGNVSKNQVTVIFKTLDSANGNKPLATKATVELYEDADYTKLARRTNEDDYAVTHIIPVDSLQEGMTYYIRIITKDASVPQHIKTISSWGGNEPIKIYTTGNLVSNCITDTQQVVAINNDVPASHNSDVAAENAEHINNPQLEATEVSTIADNVQDQAQKQNAVPGIYNVQNESHLQPGNLVQTIVSWNSSVPVATSLIYGEQSSDEKIEVPANDQLQTRHQVVLTTLKAEMTYYFKIKYVDANGNSTVSDEYSLLTPRKQETVLQKISDNFKAIFKQIKPH